MSELHLSYTPDGEWAKITTARPNSESIPYMVVLPDPDDLTPIISPNGFTNPAALHQPQWTYTASEAGTFRLEMPVDTPVKDWALELYGIPRMYDELCMTGLAALFGEASVDLLDELYANTHAKWQSFASLQSSLTGTSDITTLAEQGISELRSHAITMPADINRNTRAARYGLLNMIQDQGTSPEGTRLTICRQLLIHNHEET